MHGVKMSAVIPAKARSARGVSTVAGLNLPRLSFD
ncbi:hypothetical protein ACVWXP_001030 [Bradyrhizobium sp. USDA 4463]